MKSHKAFLPVLVSLILLSCERESFVNNEAINEFRKEISLMSGDERIESFRKLSASQKSKLWKSKFDQILSTEINSGQKEAILELKGEIEDIFYFSESVNSNITSNKKLLGWLENYGDRFSEEDGRKIFGDLSDFVPDLHWKNKNSAVQSFRDFVFEDLRIDGKKRSSIALRKVYDCDCKCTCRWGTWCPGSIGDCVTEEIECEGRLGCGLLWLQTCNGLCGVETPNPAD